MYRFALAATAILALTATGCATPPAEKSAGGAAAGQTAKAGSAASKSEGERRKKPWWRLSQYSRPGTEPVRPGDMPPGRPGLFSGKEGGFVLYRKGEGEGGPSASGKPAKVKR